MKLISCYVESFGSIKRKEFNFNDKITVFFEENGTGKTTLASFIKAMFYGLESYKSNSVGFSDRQHYYPFEGGAFGGNLTFEHNGSVYKIVRFFGEKSELQDTLQVYKNSEETSEFGYDIGKAIFGVDKPSFERTLFIGSDEIEIKSTSNINAKLNNFIGGLDGDNDLEKSLSILEKKIKEYKKSRQGKDKISEQNEKISLLTEKLANARLVQTSLEDKYTLYSQVEEEVNKLSEKINYYRRQNQALVEWERYNDIVTSIENSKKAISNVMLRYKNGVPTEAEVKAVSESIVKDKELTAELKTKTLSVEELSLYNKLSGVFENGIPNQSDIENVQTEIDGLSSISAEISLLNSQEITDEQKALNEKFKHKEPSEKSLSELEQKIEKCKSLRSEIQSLSEFETIETVKQKSSNAIYSVLAIIFALIAVAGIGVCFIKLLIGVILIAVGVVSLIAVGFVFLLKKLNSKPAFTQIENFQRQNLQIGLNNLESSINGLLQVYGYNTQNGVLFDYSIFINDYDKYKKLYEGEELRYQKITALEDKKAQIVKKLNAFFNEYKILGDNYLNNLSNLVSMVNEYSALRKRKTNLKGSESELVNKINENRKIINDFSSRYGISEFDASLIYSDLKTLKTENEAIKINTEKAEKYKAEKNITVKPIEEEVNIDVLLEELSEKQNKLSSIKVDIIADEYEVDKIDGLLNDKETARQKLDEYKQKHRLLTLTADALNKAEQNLKDKYVKPVKDDFLRYANLLENLLGEKVVMTKDFELRFERFGKERSEKHLSSGLKSVCAFCFRLALINNMYKGEKLFLVLDDPFVNLDSNHLEKINAVLSELSMDNQIIYFTCHESRLINGK